MKKIPKTILYLLIPSIILFAFILFGLGYYLDVTQKPMQSDIIVCLGGGEQERIEKSIELYRQGYAKEKILLLIGSSRLHAAYAKKYAPDVQYIAHHAKNTANEILYIKNMMKAHHYKSALIVSEPAHSRRVMMLSRIISVGGDDDFLFIPVSSGVKWWDRKRYYLNGQALSMAFLESIKMLNSYVTYGILGRLNT